MFQAQKFETMLKEDVGLYEKDGFVDTINYKWEQENQEGEGNESNDQINNIIISATKEISEIFENKNIIRVNFEYKRISICGNVWWQSKKEIFLLYI